MKKKVIRLTESDLTRIVKRILIESTVPDFSGTFNLLKSDLIDLMKENERPQKQIDKVLSLIDKAEPILEKHYVSEWKNKIPKTASPNDDYPTSQQQNQLISATKNWIRKTITDIAPYISKGDKWKLWVAWEALSWEKIDPIVHNVLIDIINAIVNLPGVSKLEEDWAMWIDVYLSEDHEFIQEMFDILVD